MEVVNLSLYASLGIKSSKKVNIVLEQKHGKYSAGTRQYNQKVYWIRFQGTSSVYQKVQRFQKLWINKEFQRFQKTFGDKIKDDQVPLSLFLEKTGSDELEAKVFTYLFDAWLYFMVTEEV